MVIFNFITLDLLIFERLWNMHLDCLKSSIALCIKMEFNKSVIDQKYYQSSIISKHVF